MARIQGLTRRAFGKAALGTVFAPSIARAKAKKPNFVVLLADDLTIDGFANAMAGFKARPDITWYKNAYSGPECDPMRATLLSGQYDFHHGVQDNTQDDVFDHTRTIAYALQNAGYKTALYGKLLQNYQTIGEALHQPPGWSDFQGFVGIAPYWNSVLNVNGNSTLYPKTDPANYETDLLANKAVKFIAANARNPFLLWVACHNPHQPATAAPRYVSAFKDAVMPRVASFGNTQINAPAWVRALSPIDAKAMDNIRKGVWKATLAVQDAANQILNALLLAGILENTVFVFATDQGIAIGEHNWISKRDVYQPTVNAPFAVRWPKKMKIARGQNDKLVSFVDLAPTLLGLAGVTPSWAMDGISIATQTRQYALLHWIGGGGNENGANVPTPGYWAVTDGRSKYVELSTGERELYDLVNDPFEMNNIADQPQFAVLQRKFKTQLQAMKP